MVSEESSTSLRVPVFNGDEKNFQSWWIKFQAYVQVKDVHAVLKDAGITITKAEMKALEEKPLHAVRGYGARTANKEKQFKLGKKNLTAMAHLTMAFGTKALLNKIVSVSSADWPGGMAYKLIDILKEKCALKDRMTVVEQTRKMNGIKLKKGTDPAQLFKLIKSVENQFSDLPQKLTEDKKIAAVFENASDEYRVILANTTRDKGTGLAVDDLEESMVMQV